MVRKLLKNGGSEWESNPPTTSEMPSAGFEDRDDHQTTCASVFVLSTTSVLSAGATRPDRGPTWFCPFQAAVSESIAESMIPSLSFI